MSQSLRFSKSEFILINNNNGCPSLPKMTVLQWDEAYLKQALMWAIRLARDLQ